VWGFVEQSACRREAILRHFGDRSQPAPDVACCDVCDPSLAPAPPRPAARAAKGRSRGAVPANGAPAATGEELDAAILDVVTGARPAVGRTRAVEILRGGRSKVIVEHSYDGLPRYGTFAHLTRDEVLGRVDELLHAGSLRSTGGRFPKLAA